MALYGFGAKLEEEREGRGFLCLLFFLNHGLNASLAAGRDFSGFTAMIYFFARRVGTSWLWETSV
jgi:hypothetical protein